MSNKTVAKNLVYNTLYQLLSIIAPIITAPYVGRILHKAGVGLYSFTNSFTTTFALFAALGFSVYGQREIAYIQEDVHKRSIIFHEIMLFRGILTAIVSIVFVVFALCYKENTIYLLPQTLIILAVSFEMSWYFQGLEEFKIIVARNAVVKLATIACTFIFIRNETDIGKYILIHSLSPFISNIIYCAVIKKYIHKVKLSDLHPLRHFKGSIEFFLPLIAVQIYSYLDKMMLGLYMPTTEENGYYEQARKITTIVVTLIVSINTVMMSRISNLYAKNDKEQIKKYYAKTFSLIIMFLLPICIGLYFVCDNFVIWYFGEEYQKVSVLLKECTVLIVFMCIGNFVGAQFLSPTGRQNQMTIIYGVAAVFNIILNIFLIPRFFSEGALYASILAELISCVLQLVLLFRSEFRFRIPLCLWKYLFSSVLMGGGIILIHSFLRISGALSTLVDVVVGAFIYILMLIVLRDENVRDVLTFIKSKLSFRRSV